MSQPPRTAGEPWNSLVNILDLVRYGWARSRPELEKITGLGRSIVAERVSDLMAHDLLEETTLGASTGGRRPRSLALKAEAGRVLVGTMGSRFLRVGIADLAGAVRSPVFEEVDVEAGPDAVLARVEALFDELLAADPSTVPVWGICLGLPGPVEFGTGRPVTPPTMPGWDGYDVRGRLTERFGGPVWIDNDVNLLMKGENRAGAARNLRDAVYLKVGSGIGAGIVADGHVHRGENGSAGDVGHITIEPDSDVRCRCGKFGCLEAIGGGVALVRGATVLAEKGVSEHLAAALAREGRLTVPDVIDAAQRGDAAAAALITRTGELVGGMVASIVSFYNPSLVLIGGELASASELLLLPMRRVLYERAIGLATRGLRVELADPDPIQGLRGAAFVLLDNVFQPWRVPQWWADKAPTKHEEITTPGVGNA